jgi:Fur family ferric uptake transcriptional regulator
MQDPMHIFAEYIADNGLKNTPQRRLIVDVFFKAGKHLSTEELYNVIREKDNTVGQATVYRTLKLLCDAGLAKELNFGETTARYEPIEDDSHHDHLICTVCGKNQEVMDTEIERLQDELARRYGFTLTAHRMILYGVCSECRQGAKKKIGGAHSRH